MEKNSIEILKDFESRISELKARISALEDELAAFRKQEEEAVPAPEPETEVDVDFNIDVIDLPAAPAEAPVPEEDLPADDLPVEDLPVEDIPLEEIPAPAVPPMPEIPVPEVPAPEVPAKPARALRTVEGNYPWQSAIPGMPVKNIRSAISLFDRALFINTLFNYALYDRTIGDLNALSSLDEAVDYLLEHFPDWNLGSDVVYSFIMAIRKKLG